MTSFDLQPPPLPNPYLIPNIPFEIPLGFGIADVELEKSDVLGVIKYAIHNLIDKIRKNGDRPISEGHLEARKR